MILKNEMSRNSIRRTFSLSEEVSKNLDLYSQAIDSSANWVVNQVLSRFFAKDKDFLEWKESRVSDPAEKGKYSIIPSKKSVKETEPPVSIGS